MEKCYDLSLNHIFFNISWLFILHLVYLHSTFSFFFYFNFLRRKYAVHLCECDQTIVHKWLFWIPKSGSYEPLEFSLFIQFFKRRSTQVKIWHLNFFFRLLFQICYNYQHKSNYYQYNIKCDFWCFHYTLQNKYS